MHNSLSLSLCFSIYISLRLCFVSVSILSHFLILSIISYVPVDKLIHSVCLSWPPNKSYNTIPFSFSYYVYGGFEVLMMIKVYLWVTYITCALAEHTTLAAAPCLLTTTIQVWKNSYDGWAVGQHHLLYTDSSALTHGYWWKYLQLSSMTATDKMKYCHVLLFY